MTLVQKIANKEVLLILDKLNLKNKIPNEVLMGMAMNQDEAWNFVYKENVPLSKQRLTRQTIILLTSLYFLYICEDEAEKENLRRIYVENEEKKREETLNKLNNLSGNY